MRSRQSKDAPTPPSESQLALEAAEWLVRLQDSDPDPNEPYQDPLERQNAFVAWLTRSPAQVRAFLEMLEVERRGRQLDPQRLIEIEDLLAAIPANVIPLHDLPARKHLANVPAAGPASLPPPRARKVALSLAAVLVVAAFAAFLSVGLFGSRTYSTTLGEQRTFPLEDGSIVVLNTDTRVEVDFSKHLRKLRLIQGEALFIVEHDAHRAFLVDAGDTTVRAVGTQFNVRRRAETTEIAVVEGVVQVSMADDMTRASGSSAVVESAGSQTQIAHGTPPVRLEAGEKAQVASGFVTKSESKGVENALLWRQRRLVFRDTPLTDVAAEFNRYNRTQIRVEGEAAQQLLLTGIFDVDHPQAIVLFALKKEQTLSVQPDGDNWVIRGR